MKKLLLTNLSTLDNINQYFDKSLRMHGLLIKDFEE